MSAWCVDVVAGKRLQQGRILGNRILAEGVGLAEFSKLALNK